MASAKEIPMTEFQHPHTLMVQGTTSDAGKSILVTAIARILARHGISVAPFKSQNMALNSAVSVEGGEIGRAQAVQAEACYLQPSVLMNPILLKPNSELGAQVILNGKAIGNMKAQQYHQMKPTLLAEVLAAHNTLSENYSAVIVEGAGSPAEVNLRERDIANMGFAEAADCPVIIVSDIDRGGVFAHLYGTFVLLSETEQARVKGFVINRFRGDVTLLDSGLTWLEEKTGVPVLAVVPYINRLHIEAEDSLTQSQTLQSAQNSDAINIGVIQYPRASNHTDFDVLRLHPQVDCRFYRDAQSFSGADVLILPGSKNVRGDLAWLLDNGWRETILRHLRYGGKLIGICGGFQMLGQVIHDPEAIESEAGSTEALNLIAMTTTLTQNKQLRNVTGQSFLGRQSTVNGYEIHAGISDGMALEKPLFTLTDGQSSFTDGVISDDKQILGSYLHGLFDKKDFLDDMLQWAGLNKTQEFDYATFRDQEINRLADVVEQVLPLQTLTDLLSLPARKS
jgi:adenosylcobyric acid synthase